MDKLSPFLYGKNNFLFASLCTNPGLIYAFEQIILIELPTMCVSIPLYCLLIYPFDNHKQI